MRLIIRSKTANWLFFVLYLSGASECLSEVPIIFKPNVLLFHQEESQQDRTVVERGTRQEQNKLTKAIKQSDSLGRISQAEVQAPTTKNRRGHEVDGATCLSDFVEIRLREMTPWQTGELPFEMQQGAAVRNLTNSYVMVNLWIHYSGSYTSKGSTHSPRYSVEVDKRPSLLLEPRVQATDWNFPVKDVYVWVPHSHWELTATIDAARSTCYLYPVPPPHWDTDSHKLLKGTRHR